MLIQKFSHRETFEAFDIKGKMIYPWDAVPPTPFKSAFGIVEPGKIVKPHAHHEGETFIIVQGSGIMTVDGESEEVSFGDVIYMPPLQSHLLENTSDSETLVFVTLWWDDPKILAEANRERLAQPRRKYLINSSPPTPNGTMHLGHLAGPYLSGDIIARFLRLRGADVLYVSQSDEHQSYVQLKADQEKTTGEEICDRYYGRMRAAFEAAQIDFNAFPQLYNNPEHRELTTEIFKHIHAKGLLIERTTDVPYDEELGMYLLEGYVRGVCPSCGEDSDALACEACCRLNGAHELSEPRSTLTGKPVGTRPLKRLFLPFEPFRERLLRFYRESDIRPWVRAVAERALAGDKLEIAVTQPYSWGTQVPVEGYEDQTLLGSFEVTTGFLTSTREAARTGGMGQDWQEIWADPDRQLVQLCGVDNGMWFTLVFPTLCLAYDDRIDPPTHLIPNYFYLLEEEKFSTTRNHRILAADFLQDVSADLTRLYLAYSNPETRETNFRQAEFDALVQREIEGGLVPWLRRLDTTVREEFGGAAPNTGVWTQAQRRFYQRLNDLVRQAAEAYEPASFSPQAAARAILEIIRLAKAFGESEQRWTATDYTQDERATSITLELCAAKALAFVAYPILPSFGARLWDTLGFGEPMDSGNGEVQWEDELRWLPEGQTIGALSDQPSLNYSKKAAAA